MRKKTTAPRSREHRRASTAQQVGLIAQGENAPQSAAAKPALDNRSHRTDCVSAAGDPSAARTIKLLPYL